MATVTPINSWPVPESTDLVKDGAVAIESLGDAIDASVGSGLLAWQSWAPTLGGGWLNGNGTWTATYCQIGKTVHIRAAFTVGSTTTKGTNMTISLPVTAAWSSTVSNCYSAIGGTQYALLARLESTTSTRILAQNAGSTYLTVTQVIGTGAGAIPAAWSTSDSIAYQITYQAA